MDKIYRLVGKNPMAGLSRGQIWDGIGLKRIGRCQTEHPCGNGSCGCSVLQRAASTVSRAETLHSDMLVALRTGLWPPVTDLYDDQVIRWVSSAPASSPCPPPHALCCEAVCHGQGRTALAGACNTHAGGKAIVSGRLWQGHLGDTPRLLSPQERGSQR